MTLQVQIFTDFEIFKDYLFEDCGALTMTEPEYGRKQRATVRVRVTRWAKKLKCDITALYLAYKHPKTPVYARIAAALVVGYAISPIDLIPDFVPVLGYLDDLLILPLGIAFTVKLIPHDVMAECRRAAGLVVIGIWVIIVLSCVIPMLRHLYSLPLPANAFGLQLLAGATKR